MKFIRKYKSHGWFNESFRHSLAAKGIKSKTSFANRYLFDEKEDDLRAKSELLKKEKDAIASAYFREKQKQKEGRVPTKAKQEERQATEEAFREKLKEPFTNALEGLASGDLTQSVGDKSSLTSGEQLKVRDAAYEGARNEITARNKYFNDSELKKLKDDFFLSDEDIKVLRQTQKESRLERSPGRQALESGAEKTEAAIGKGVEAVGKGVYGLGKKGVNKISKSFEAQSGAGKSPAQVLRDKIQDEEKEMKEAQGLFNPLKIAFGDSAIADSKAKKHAFEEAHDVALQAEREVDSIFDNKQKFAKVDLGSFNAGVKAFEKGDRQTLISSINELESQNMKLKNKIHIVAEATGVVKSKKNLEQSTHMEDYDDGEGFGGNNFLFSSGSGASKISNQINKLADVQGEMTKSSNEVATRIGLLRHRLKQLDSIAPIPKVEVPKTREINVVEGSGSGLFSSFENSKGVFKHENPVLETKFKSDNPALRSVSE